MMSYMTCESACRQGTYVRGVSSWNRPLMRRFGWLYFRCPLIRFNLSPGCFIPPCSPRPTAGCPARCVRRVSLSLADLTDGVSTSKRNRSWEMPSHLTTSAHNCHHISGGLPHPVFSVHSPTSRLLFRARRALCTVA